ncbi:MAG: glycosyltransferase [Planctomycetia bacterium]|nr:glycosyltransferase [Planctomycetia bacterium]
MRVLWLCNVPVSLEGAERSGSWLGAMAKAILSPGGMELGVISMGPAAVPTETPGSEIRQWTVPALAPIGRDGLPERRIVDWIVKTTASFAPDLVQIWGTESYWGLLVSRGFLAQPAILTVQGVKHQIAHCFEGGLTRAEQRTATGLREFLRRTTIQRQKSAFQRWGTFEREIMAAHRWVECQTPWQEAQVRECRPDAHVFRLNLPLRESFKQSDGWQGATQETTIFLSASYPAPFKGLHTAIRAVAILKRRVPGVQLRLAGCRPSAGLRRDGYLHWLSSEIRDLGLERNICWLGTLSAPQIVAELRTASAALVPSFIESYCMAMAEAMRIGTPTVASYTGGTAYLGSDEESCLFFPPGDAAMCAYQLERILSDPDLARRLSLRAREIALLRHDQQRIAQGQLAIYEQVLASMAGAGTTSRAQAISL